MPRITIDQHDLDVPPATTLLAAARQLGLDIPTLCYRDGCRPDTTCMVCLVKVARNGVTLGAASPRSPHDARPLFVPACATAAEDGMVVESETDEVGQVRRAALELLLSDHAGQCRAPCQYACPFNSDVPALLRHIAAGRIDEAIAALRAEIPLAAVMTRIGRNPCDRACRRSQIDRRDIIDHHGMTDGTGSTCKPVCIGTLQRYAADRALSALRTTPLAPREGAGGGSQPSSESARARRVVIIGAGPAGLSAAHFLLGNGHACTIFESDPEPGGTLRALPPHLLPPEVLRSEVSLLHTRGARFHLNRTISGEAELTTLRTTFDAVLLATGRRNKFSTRRLPLIPSPRNRDADPTAYQTEHPNVFAAGDAFRPRPDPTAAAVDGKAAAWSIDRFLRGQADISKPKLTALRLPRLERDELLRMLPPQPLPQDASPSPPTASHPLTAAGAPAPATRDMTDDQARAAAARCLHCDCHKHDACRLRIYAERYGADPSRYRGPRRLFERRIDHPDVVFEPGKCILCGLCVQITEQAREPVGLTIAGRGFDTRIAVPFDESIAAALQVSAAQCVAVCPTGALAWRDTPPAGACNNACTRT